MRSLPHLKPLAFIGAAMLSGCLVSETPVLDASNGKAKPLKPGSYIMCPVSDEEDECKTFEILRDDTGLYQFVAEDEEPTLMRFRRVGHRGYAVQTLEDDDAYMYYYGKGSSKRFTLTMMLCEQLPTDLRATLIEDGDLQSDSDDFETCTVNTVGGLIGAARAYHRGEVVSDDGIAFELTKNQGAQ